MRVQGRIADGAAIIVANYRDIDCVEPAHQFGTIVKAPSPVRARCNGIWKHFSNILPYFITWAASQRANPRDDGRTRVNGT
jgi:hypothetical protein